MIKNYTDWLNEMIAPMRDMHHTVMKQPKEETFTEKAEITIKKYETKLDKEGFFTIGGVNIGPAKFWELLKEFSKYQDMHDDLGKFMGVWYYKHYRNKTGESTQEYKDIVNKWENNADRAFKAGKKIDHFDNMKILNDALSSNLIEKHLGEYKAIYKKYLDFVHSKRGIIQGKKFGL